jgi:hypothetical protein
MKRKNLLCITILSAGFATLNIATAVGSDSHQPRQHWNVTKRQAEEIALGKVHWGRIRTAELLISNGDRFWSVYVVRSGSMNAKEVHVDAASGKVLAVQTERPEDQAEEPTGRD